VVKRVTDGKLFLVIPKKMQCWFCYTSCSSEKKIHLHRVTQGQQIAVILSVALP